MTRTTDPPEVIVVGAGPAGASAASVLGEAGRRVLLIDRADFPREKTCGDGLTHKCLPHLERLGLLDEFLSKVEVTIHGYSLYFTNGVEVTMRDHSEGRAPFAFVMARYDFDELLVSGARRHATVTLEPRTRVDRLLLEDGRVVGVAGTNGAGAVEYRAGLVIDATGASSSLPEQVGAGYRDPTRSAVAIRGYYDGVEALSDTIELYFDEQILPGYFWVFPTSTRSANVGCGTFQHLVKERRLNIRDVLEGFIREHPVARRKLGRATLRGPLRGGPIPLPLVPGATHVRDGLLMTGDTAAFVDPLTAEGISFSMHSGIRAGETAIGALEGGGTRAADLRAFDDWRGSEYEQRFGKSIFYEERLPESFYTGLVGDRLRASGAVERAGADRGAQYELGVKLKALLKAL